MNYIKDFIKNYGIPDELGTYNGKEFSNKKLKNYLTKNNIKFIHGSAYNPRSQGCVERLHRTIKISLICNKLENKNNFNIIKALNYTISTYNNTIHSTIGYKPIEVFYSSSLELKNQVYINTLNSFKYINRWE